MSTESVLFERSIEGFQRSTLDRATAAKIKLENFYKNISQQVREREDRKQELLQRLKEETNQDRVKKQLNNLAQKEANYLRLRRARLGVDDFTKIKVIGKVISTCFMSHWLRVHSVKFVWFKEMILARFMQ
jgi:hypothetical protein